MKRISEQRRSESPELGQAILRQLRGLVARATEGDLEAVEQLRMVQAAAGRHVGLAVAGARSEVGYSWAQLAPALGMARTTASELYRDVQPLRSIRTSCGRVVFSEASRYLHERRCTSCAADQASDLVVTA